MANKKSNKQIGAAFLENIWGKRERGIPLPKINWSNQIKHEDVLYLLNHYPFLQIVSSNPSFGEEVQVKLLKAQSGWTIHDYGDAMSSSLGGLLFGDYSAGTKTKPRKKKNNDDEGGEGGGTIVNQAVTTAREMILKAIEKGWPGVEIVAGTPLMQWAAWMIAQEKQFSLGGYEPTKQDKAKHERVRKLRDVEIAEGSTPKLKR